MKLTILFLLLSFSLFGRSYYLSPMGNDNNSGTLSSPCFTLNRLWPYLVPGDSVIMRGGVYKYNSEQLLINKNGVYGRPITLINYKNENPVITKGSVSRWVYYAGVLVMGDYLKIHGLEITGWNQETSDHLYYGIILENCHNVTIAQCNIHHNGFGLVVGDWSTNYSNSINIQNCDLHDNADPLTSYGTNTPWGGADGIRIGTQDPDAVINVTGCRMWGNSDDGVDTYNCNSTINFLECWSFLNGFKPEGSAAGNGIGFKLGPSVYGYPGEIKRSLKNCFAGYNRSIGFDQNTGLMRTELINNTAVGNARGFMFNYGLDYKIQHISINNLSVLNTFGSAPVGQFSPQSAILNCSFISVGWQCIDNPLFMPSVYDFVTLDIHQLERPRIGGKGLPLITSFHLKASSLLIDEGYETTLPWSGTLPDIGCFEFYE